MVEECAAICDTVSSVVDRVPTPVRSVAARAAAAVGVVLFRSGSVDAGRCVSVVIVTCLACGRKEVNVVCRRGC